MAPAKTTPAAPSSAKAGGAGASPPRPEVRHPDTKWRSSVQRAVGEGHELADGGDAAR